MSPNKFPNSNFIKRIIFLLTCWMALSANSQEVLDRVVAQVDKEPILETELMQAIYFEAQNLDPTIFQNEQKLDSMKRVVLKTLIDFRVLLTAAKLDTNIKINESELQNRAQSDYQRLVAQVGSAERLEERFGTTTKKIKRDLEDNARKSIYVQRYVERKLDNIRVTRSEIENFWNENKEKFGTLPATVRIANILFTFKPNELAKSIALQKADSIKKLIENGKDFVELAKENSSDNSAKYGGDLGEVERGTFLPEFETTVYRLTEGEVSRPVETMYGFHIIKLHDRRGDKFHASHILIGVTPTREDSMNTKRKADSVYQVLLQGENFEQLARRVSEDSETAKRGGDMGWIELNKLPEFATQIKSMKDGEITKPFLFSKSYHILKRMESKPERLPKLQEDWERIEQLAQSNARSIAYEKLASEARKKVFIKIFEE